MLLALGHLLKTTTVTDGRLCVRTGFAPGNTPVRHLLVRECEKYKTPTFVGSCDRLTLRGSGSLSRYSLIKLPP